MSRLKTLIDANIKENGNQEITGNVLNYVLNEIADEVKREGYFPDMSVGFADNLVGRGESVPAEFTFRASGGKSIKDGAARIKRIKGNSVVWNNMVDTRGYEAGFLIREGIKIQQGHKYLLQRSAANDEFHLIPVVDGSEKYEMGLLSGQYAKIFTSQYTDTTDARVYSNSYCGACVISDLTLMFGAGNEPTTIEEYNARKPIVADEYAYNEGQVIHCNTESIKSVGDNAWDEQWEVGALDHSNGKESISSTRIRSKNFCRIIGGEEYYLVGNNYNIVLYDENYQWLDYWGAIGEPRKISIDSRARWFKVSFDANYGTTYKNDALISLYHSGWKAQKDDQYQPYWQDTLPLPIIRKYFPDGMKSAGYAHDEIRFNKASGKWEKVVRIAGVDLGSLDYNLDTRFDNAQFYCDTSWAMNNNIRCGLYVTIEGGWDTNKDKTITRTSGGQILIVDSAYTDVASFKAAMQGVILYYELAEPVIREIDEPIGTDYRVADFGTEQAISSVPSAPFSADIIYQFNAVDMIRELWLKVQELESRVAQL